MDLFKRLTGRPTKRRKATRKKTSGRRRTTRKASGRPWTALLLAGLAVVLIGAGLLNWAQTRHGRAALLSLGANKNYDEVQVAVDEALAAALPGFRPGPAADPVDHDWPAPGIGPGALIRCRLVTVAGDESWWDVQARVAAAVQEAGAGVLWGERLWPRHRGRGPVMPDEQQDLLRLDIGVTGRPTHTLVLAREGRTPPVRWGGGPGLSRWREFAGLDGPVVALVIDDWGHSKTRPALDIMDLPVPLTMAVLPGLPYSRYFSLQGTELVLPPGAMVGSTVKEGDAAVTDGRTARLDRGCPVEVAIGREPAAWPRVRREIMLHLPMEPLGYPEADPGPNPILVGMDTAQITQRLEAALGTLESAHGVNNHMGSAATSDQATMRNLMAVLTGRDLFFVDSLTSSRSVAYAEAERAGIPAARNRIFLDYDNENEATIAANLERLVQAARAAGTALGIGHPHPATAAVLAREVPRLAAAGVRFVTVSELMALRSEADRLASVGKGDAHGS